MKMNLRFAGLAVVGVMNSSSFAADLYWDAGDSANKTNFFLTTNWDIATGGGGGDPGSAPGASDTAVFNVSSLNSAQRIALDGPLSIGGFVFRSTGTTSILTDGAANKAITLGAGGIDIRSGAGRVNFGTNAVNQRITFTLSASQTWQNNSANIFTNAANNTIALGGNLLRIDGTGGMFLGGVISGTAGNSMTKNGSGSLLLSGANTFNGGFTNNSGRTLVGNNAAFGATAGRLVLNGGAVSGSDAATARTIANVFTFGGDVALGDATDIAKLTFSGAGTLSGSRIVTINSPVVFSNAIGDGGGGFSLTKNGDSALSLSGANTYSGGTTINAGILNFASKTAKPATGTVTIGADGGLSLAVTSVSDATYWGLADIDALWTGSLTGFTIDSDFKLVGIDTTGGDLSYSTSQSTRGLAKFGVNILTLDVANTYEGGTYIYGGTLKMGHADAIKAGTVVTVYEGAFDLNGNTLDMTVRINANNSLGGAPLILNGGHISALGGVARSLNNNYQLDSDFTFGNTTDYGTLTLSGAGTLSGTRTITVPTGSTNVLSGIIGDGDNAYGIVKQGGGRLYLQGANTFDGVITVEQGQLAINAGGGLGSTAGGTVVKNGAVLRIQASATIDENITLTGTGEGAGGNTYGALLMNVNGGTWTYNGVITLDGGAAIETYFASLGSVTFTQGIAGTGDLTLSVGSSNNGGATYILNGQSSYTGDTYLQTISASNITVRIGINNALPTTTVLRMLPGTSTPKIISQFSLNGYNQEVAGLAATAADTGRTNAIVGGSATLSTLTVNNAADFSFGGRMGGGNTDENNLALLKKGVGALALTFTNTFTGGTTIEAGRIRVGSNTALGSGTLTMTGGGLSVVSTTARNLANPYAFSGNIALGDATDSGALTLSGAGTLTGNTVLNVASSTTLSNAIEESSGSWSLTKEGGGALTLTGANVFTGGTVIQSGILNAGHTSALGSVGNIRFEGGTLQYSAASAGQDWAARFKNSASTISLDTAGQSVTLTGIIDNSNVGGLTKLGTGALTLSANNSYSGTTTIGGGVLVASNANALGTGNITFTGGTLAYTSLSTAGNWAARFKNSTSPISLNLTNVTTVTLSGNIDSSNTGGLTLNGTNTSVLILSGANTYTGPTSVRGLSSALATLRITSDQNLGAAPLVATESSLVLNAGTLRFDASMTLDPNRGVFAGAGTGFRGEFQVMTGYTVTYGGVIQGGQFRSTGGGTLKLTGTSSTFNETFYLLGNGGVVEIGNIANIGVASSVGTGSTIWLGNSGSVGQTVILRYVGTGDSSNRRIQIGGGTDQHFMGGTIQSSGTGALVLTGDTLPQSGAVVARTFTLGGPNRNDNTFSGVIADNSAAGRIDLVKADAGKWILSNAANTYSGTTTVSGGILQIDGSNQSASMTVNENAALIMNGTYTAGLITVNANGVLGGSGTVGDVSFVETGRLLFNPGLTLTVAEGKTVSFAGFGVADLVDVNGNDYSIWSATVSPNIYTLISGPGTIDFANISDVGAGNAVIIGNGKSAYFQEGSLQLVIIPEPASLGVLGILALAALLRRRVRR